MNLTYESDFLRLCQERGHIKQITDAAGLDKYAIEGAVGYIGFDATASSLHIGSLVQIMMLRRLQQSGGRPIVLVGGGTTRIGDPSERTEQRPILSPAQIDANIAGIGKVFERFLEFGSGGAIMTNNADWLCDLNYLDFLREMGRHFSINVMVKQDTVARRLREEKPYSFLEFNYSLLQAYDFLELYRRHGCRLQLGGSDQWSNIIGGVDLCRRVEGASAFGLTAPLITLASGAKMGKTAKGAIWLDADLCPVYDYWQFWRDTADADTGRFLRLFTEIETEEIARLEALQGAEINAAKIALADAATAMLHGKAAAEQAGKAAGAAFGSAGAAEGMPGLVIERGRLAQGYGVIDACVASGLASSKSEARRHVRAGAVRLNGQSINDENRLLTGQDFSAGEARLSVGKKKHVRLMLE